MSRSFSSVISPFPFPSCHANFISGAKACRNSGLSSSLPSSSTSESVAVPFNQWRYNSSSLSVDSCMQIVYIVDDDGIREKGLLLLDFFYGGALETGPPIQPRLTEITSNPLENQDKQEACYVALYIFNN